MVVDGLSKSLPSGASVLEVADYFALFGIDADDRQAALGELGVLLGDVLKLLSGSGPKPAETRLWLTRSR